MDFIYCLRNVSEEWELYKLMNLFVEKAASSCQLPWINTQQLSNTHVPWAWQILHCVVIPTS